MHTDKHLRGSLVALDLQYHGVVVCTACVVWVLFCTSVAFVATTELERARFETAESSVSDQNENALKGKPQSSRNRDAIPDCNCSLESRIQSVEAELTNVTQQSHQLKHHLRRDSLSPRRRSMSPMSPTLVQSKPDPDRIIVDRVKTCIRTVTTTQKLLHQLPIHHISAFMLTKEIIKGVDQVMAWLSMATPVVLALEIFCLVDIDVRDAKRIAE